MWPTFYIPGLSVGDSPEWIDPDVGYVCGEWSNSVSITITAPTGIADGDTQLIVISHAGGTPTLPTADGNPWWLFGTQDRSYGSFGNGKQSIYWRRYDSADGDPVVLDAGAGSRGAWLSMIVKNQNTEDPLFNAFASLSNQTLQHAGPFWNGPITGLECAQSGDLFVLVSPPSEAEFSDVTGPSAGDGFEFFCNNWVNPGVDPRLGHVVSGASVYKNRQNNLLRGCPSLDATYWTFTNLSAAPASGSTYMHPAVLNDGGTETKHYCEQEVTLEAGKTYLLSAACYHALSGFTGQTAVLYMTVLNEAGDEAGVKCGFITSPPYLPELVSANDTSILPNNQVDRGFALYEGFNGNRSSSVACFYVRPSTTETYRVRLYVSRWDTDPTGSPGTSNPAGSVSISGLALQETPGYHTHPAFLETTSAPILPGDVPGIMPVMVRQSIGTSGEPIYNALTALILRRSGGARPVAKLLAPGIRNIMIEMGDTTVSTLKHRATYGSWLSQTGSLPLYAGIFCTHAVYGLLAQKKFYYEMTPVAFGAGGALATYSIGFCPTSTVQAFPVSSRVGTYANHYAYCADGKIYENGSLATTITGWTAGDDVGASIDFTNFEIKFYRNGTLVHTADISASTFAYGVWTAHCGAPGHDTAGETAEFEWNFTGPFGGRKPSGFYAYDFDNEVA